MRFSLIVDGTPIDLFQDETIELNRQYKDLTDLGKVMTDFTKSFTIPATDVNNSVFSNWFEENVLLTSWNQNIALDAEIHLHGLPVFYGKVELQEVNFIDGLPRDYAITFYGQGKSLLTTWGEDTMVQIDWSEYDHTVDDGVVEASWTGGLNSGELVWDIKDYGIGYVYSSDNVQRNLRKENVLTYKNLRPSILLKKVVEKIFTDYDLTIGGTLLDRPEFTNLFVTPMNTQGPYEDPYQGRLYNFEATNTAAITLSPNTAWSGNTRLAIGDTSVYDPSSLWDTGAYEYTVPKTGKYTFEITFTTISGGNPFTDGISIWVSKNGAKTKFVWFDDFNQFYVKFENKPWRVYLPCDEGDKISWDITYVTQNPIDLNATVKCVGSPYFSNPVVSMKYTFPNTKITEFLSSFLKTFNGIVVPISETSYELHNLEDWYNSGTIKEYTEYIDFKSINHKKVEIPKKVMFKHDDGQTTQSQEYFRQTHNRLFGDVEFSPEVDFSTGELEIKSMFSVLPLTFTNAVTKTGYVVGATQLQIPWVFDAEIKGTKHDYILFYFQEPTAINEIVYLGSNQMSSLPISSPFSGIGQDAYSVAFGLESNVSGDLPKNTLYFGFWNEYISRLYSSRSRIVTMTAHIPVGEWLDMNLNDVIAISGNYYILQKVTYDLTTEKGKIELMTYPNVDVLEITSTSGSGITWGDPVSADAGLTFVRGDFVKTGFNALSDGTNWVGDPDTDGDKQATPLGFSTVSLTDALANVLALNKGTMWWDTPQTVLVDPAGATILYDQYQVLGDESYYTFDPMSGTITIEESGNYSLHFAGTVDVQGSVRVKTAIMTDGSELPNVSITEGNHHHSINVMVTNVFYAGNTITVNVSSDDGSSSPEDFTRVYLTIQRLTQ
jgi:hypothetical protein